MTNLTSLSHNSGRGHRAHHRLGGHNVAGDELGNDGGELRPTTGGLRELLGLSDEPVRVHAGSQRKHQ